MTPQLRVLCFCCFYCVLCFMLEIKSQRERNKERKLRPPLPFFYPTYNVLCVFRLLFRLLRAKRVLHVISFSLLLLLLLSCSLLLHLLRFLTAKLKSVLGQKVNVPQARTDHDPYKPKKNRKTEKPKSLAAHLSITIHTQSTRNFVCMCMWSICV